MWYTGGEVDYGALLGLLTAQDIDDIETTLLASINMAIGRATFDGTTWSKDANPVLEKGTADAWDGYGIGTPWVIRHSATDYEMWYTGAKTVPGILRDFLLGTNDLETTIINGTNVAIGHATSTNGISWARDANPVLSKGAGDVWDKYGVGAPSVIKMGDTYKMWYTGAKSYLSTFILDILGGSDLATALSNTNVAIGYATYTPPEEEEEEEVDEEEDGVVIVDLVVTAEDIEEMTTEEAAEAIEEMTTEEAADIIEELTIETAVNIIEELTIETAVNIIEEVTTETAVDIIEEVTTETAVDIIEEVTTETAVDIIEGVTTETAVDIIEGVTTETAVDIVEGVTTETAADIIEEVTTETAADIIEEVTTETAVDIVEEVNTPKAADILEEVAVKKAAAIMEEVTTDKLTVIVSAMSEESLTERLPELTADKLHEIPPAVLFEALPNAPTEQLVDEIPPEPPPDLRAPVMVYETPTGVRYMTIKTTAGEWVTIVGSPFPVDKLMIKVTEALENVETIIEEVTAPPEAAKLPSDVSVASFLDTTLKNITPEQMLVGHMTFVVDKTWIEENNINKWSVFLNRYDKEAGKWVKLPTTKKDETDDYVYYNAAINEFSLFAIAGSSTVPALEFKASNLTINPATARAGESVTVTADIKNELGITDKYAASLWINSTLEDVNYLTLAKGEKTTVSFDVTKDKTGSYQVRIGRQMGSFEVLPPLPPVVPKPAAFEVSQLSITPAEVKIGEVVTISAVVTNIGEVEGSYEAVLKVDGVPVATEVVTLGAGEGTKVVFSVTKDVAATYQVRIEQQTGSFEVLPPLPPVVPKPAAFEVSQLSIAPAEVKIGEVVTISAMVSNIGEVEGSYEAVLKVDGVPVATEAVTLGAGESTKVVFSVTKDVAATYQVEVDGQYGEFTVVTPVPPPPFPWWWIVVGVVVIGLLVFFLVIRRRAIEG